MARIDRSLFANAPQVSIAPSRSSQGDLALKELSALKFCSDLALPPDAAELRSTRLLGAPTQRDALRLPALGTMDAAACVALVEGLARRDLDAIEGEDAAPVREMQAVLRDLVNAAQPERTHRPVRI